MIPRPNLRPDLVHSRNLTKQYTARADNAGDDRADLSAVSWLEGTDPEACSIHNLGAGS